MTARFTTILAFFACLHSIGQSASENYVRTTIYQIATQDSNVTNTDKIEQVTYYDGLGSPKQVVGIRQTPTQKDIITHIEYDAFGRQPREYLPVPMDDGQSGTFRNIDMPSEINSYYTSNFGNDIDPNGPNPYSEKFFEPSPLNRVLKQAAPGKDWAMGNNHEISFDYQANTAADQVALFRVTFSSPSNTEVPLISRDGYYSPSQLYKTITYDENYDKSRSLTNYSTEEFKDKQGRVILKRTYNNGEPHDTYYVYDDFGNLTFVFPPKLSQLIGTSSFNPSIDGLGYQYRYDYRNRLIEKKIPGKDWEYIVYNRLDQPVLTQDANLRSQNKWLFTKYDAFGRVVYTGIFNSNTNSRGEVQSNADQVIPQYEKKLNKPISVGGTMLIYSNDSYPNYNLELLTINFYDNYNFDRDGITVPDKVYNTPISNKTKSLPTGSKVRVLGTNDWITSLSYYDDKGQVIYTATKNTYLGTEDHSLSKLDFTGKVLETQTIHNKENQDQVNIQNEYTYDHTGRPQLTKQRTDKLIYDDLTGFQKEGNTLTKTAGASWYNNNITSSNQIVGDGYATWTFDRSNPRAFIGFSNQDNGSSHKTIQYSIYAYIDRVLIAEGNGTSYQWKFSGTSSNGGGFKAGDELMMKRKNGIISYYKNGALLYTSQTPNYAPLIVDGSIYPTGVKVINLTLYNDTQELISKNVYDELGQLVKKDVGNDEATPLQQVDYSYNIRGWLKEINSVDDLGEDLFSFDLGYNSNLNNATPLFNGNISSTRWKTANDGVSRWYAYRYDALNRIEGATYDNIDNNETNWFSLSNVAYDKNGNLMSLNRTKKGNTNSGAALDYLTYTYYQNSNILQSVEEQFDGAGGFEDGNSTGTDYTYDDNGNMVTDANKGIDIEYNHLNLPTLIRGDGDSRIQYTYDATGRKLRKFVRDGFNFTYTDYADNGIYKGTSLGAMSLEFINHSEGYIEPNNSGGFSYVYQYKDHLGNVRLSYSDLDLNGAIDPNTEILEENNYYPFGLEHKGYNNVVNGTEHPYKYNGKEHNQELGLDWYDFGARNYDPALGRWMNLDPLAEKMRRHSPYNYAFDNPLWYIDPDGMKPFDWRDKNGNLVYDAKKGEYTKHATADHKRFGNSLLKTSAGRKQFNKLVNSSIPITTEISSGKGPSTGTSYVTGTTTRTKDGNTGKVKKADIVIYEGRINDLMTTIDKFYDARQESKLSEQNQLYHENTETNDERIAAVAGHEIEHATSEANHKLTGAAGEVEPEAIETEILKQTPGSKPIKITPMPIKIEPIKIEIPEIKN